MKLTVLDLVRHVYPSVTVWITIVNCKQCLLLKERDLWTKGNWILLNGLEHDHTMTWKYSAHEWPSVRGFHRSTVVTRHKWPVIWSLDVFYVVDVNNLLNKQSMWRWLTTPWCSCLVVTAVLTMSIHGLKHNGYSSPSQLCPETRWRIATDFKTLAFCPTPTPPPPPPTPPPTPPTPTPTPTPNPNPNPNPTPNPTRTTHPSVPLKMKYHWIP